MIDTDDLALIGDNIHFAAAGQLVLGERFAEAHLSVKAEELPAITQGGTLLLWALLAAAGTVLSAGCKG